MDHLQNVLSYFDQQQPLCAEHDRIPKDPPRGWGVRAGYPTRPPRVCWQV